MKDKVQPETRPRQHMHRFAEKWFRTGFYFVVSLKVFYLGFPPAGYTSSPSHPPTGAATSHSPSDLNLPSGSSWKEHWPMEKIITRAMESTAELKAVALDVVKAENLAQQAGLWNNPEASLNAGPMIAAGNNGAPGGSGFNLEASLKQSIPLFGEKSVQRKLETQNKKTSETAQAIELLSTQHKVALLAYRLGSILERAKHISHRRERIQLIDHYLSSRPFASPSQIVEKTLIKNRIREIEEQFLEITTARNRAWQALNIYLALPDPIIPDIQWILKPKDLSRDTFWKGFQNQNPELLRQVSVVTAAEIAIEQAGKLAYPSLLLGVDYDVQTAGSRQDIYNGVIEVSIPILNTGSYAKKAAEAARDAESYRLEQRKRELAAQFDQAWDELLKNKSRIELYPLKLTSQLEAEMDRAERNWRRNLISAVAFLELENQTHEQTDKIYDAQTGYIEALSQLDFLSGLPFIQRP